MTLGNYPVAGLSLNVKKRRLFGWDDVQVIKIDPFSIKWFHGPVKILGIHFSYDDKENNELNFLKSKDS